MPPVHADVPLGQGKQEFYLWCPACPTLCWQTLGKVVFKILKGEIRAGEQPTSALCTATGLLWKMSVISTTLAAEHHCARGWRPCPNVQLLCVLTATLCSFGPLKQLFPLGCGCRGQSQSLSHPAFTAQPDQALPEAGLQRVPRPDVNTCVPPIISWHTAHPTRAPLSS